MLVQPLARMSCEAQAQSNSGEMIEELGTKLCSKVGQVVVYLMSFFFLFFAMFLSVYACEWLVMMWECGVWEGTSEDLFDCFSFPKTPTTLLSKRERADMSKKKRKNKAPHAQRPAPNVRRQVISYDDIEEDAAPPVPRQKVSYASDSNNEDDKGGEQPPEKRHAVVSQDALRERERPQADITYGQIGAFPGLDPRDNKPFYGPANDGLDYLRMVR